MMAECDIVIVEPTSPSSKSWVNRTFQRADSIRWRDCAEADGNSVDGTCALDRASDSIGLMSDTTASRESRRSAHGSFYSDSGVRAFYRGDEIHGARSISLGVENMMDKSYDNKSMVSAFSSVHQGSSEYQDSMSAVSTTFSHHRRIKSKNSIDGVSKMFETNLTWSGGKTSPSLQQEFNRSSPRESIDTGGVTRISPDKSILDNSFEDDLSIKSNENHDTTAKTDDGAKKYSHVSAAHEILSSFIALNPRREDDLETITTTNSINMESSYQFEDRVDHYTRKSPKSTDSYYGHSPITTSKLNFVASSDNTSPVQDSKILNERLRLRLAERNAKLRMIAADEEDSIHEESNIDKRLLLKSRHMRPIIPRGHSAFVPRLFSAENGTGSDNSNTKSEVTLTTVFPEVVTFDSEEGEGQPIDRFSFRKSVSESGCSFDRSTTARTFQREPHRIGILQPDGVIFDDALLLRLARQARYGRLRGEVPPTTEGVAVSGSEEQKFNVVQIHVYDLLQKDALVEMPYFNCNFPIGKCFQVMNNAANCLGTGAYHVGVEVNGVEYAFGANNIIGMSGIFTCTPKHSPGYEYRETLDFGTVHTTRNTWIHVPKKDALAQTISHELDSRDTVDRLTTMNSNVPSTHSNEYTFRKLESFADGNTVIHSMAREYMGTDYDLLRKNCCTFARDVCLRLGVKEEDIPSWFHNAAQVGADAEDAITNAEQTVKNMFDCADIERDPVDLMEGYNHGFEVIADLKRGSPKLKVVESPPVYVCDSARQPLHDCDEQSEFWETLSWTY